MTQTAPSPQELQELIAHIQGVAEPYAPDTDYVTLYNQRAEIRSAARDLLLAMSSPDDLMWHKVLNMLEAVMIRTALRLQVFRAVPLKGSISRADLARKVSATESLIGRMMLILVGTRLFDQTAKGEYKHTDFSKTFMNPETPSHGGFWQNIFDIYLRPLHNFDDYVVETVKDGLYSEPTSNFFNPFNRYHGKDGDSMWEVLASTPNVGRVFHTQLKMVDFTMPITGSSFDFGQFKAIDSNDDRIQLVDIGGSNGRILLDILSANPDLDPTKCVLQDIEKVLVTAQAARDAGIAAQTIDFHKEQPVKGAKAYYMRFISHDYFDSDLINILGHIAEAMALDSKLLICDTILPDRLEEATLPAGSLDQILFCCGGKERTKKEFEELFHKVGLQLSNVHPMPGTSGAIIVGKIKSQQNGKRTEAWVNGSADSKRRRL